MSLVVKLMIGGWATTLAMIAVCALNESGKLFNISKRIASWMQPSHTTSARSEEKEYPDTVQAD
jgi:hypothetical protein